MDLKSIEMQRVDLKLIMSLTFSRSSSFHFHQSEVKKPSGSLPTGNVNLSHTKEPGKRTALRIRFHNKLGQEMVKILLNCK